MQFYTLFAVAAAMMLGAEARLPKSLQERWGFLDSPEFNQGAQRIVKGEQADPGEAPYQTSIQQNLLGIFKSHICGGSLIDRRTIVTAAHCTVGQDVKQIINRFGTDNQKKAGALGDFNTGFFINHPKYNSDTIENDIALIKLPKDVQPGGNIAFVEFDSSAVPGGVPVTVYGWGLTVGGSQNTPDMLQRGHLKTMTNDECHAKWGEHNAIAKGMLCAQDANGASGSAATTACNGDSGGPLVEKVGGKTLLRGLVSWGENGCKGNMPNVYTRVSEYIDWIKEGMEKN